PLPPRPRGLVLPPPGRRRGNAPAPPGNQLAQPDVAQRFLNVDVLRQLAVQLQLILHARVLQLRARVAKSLVLPGLIRQHETSHQATHRLLRGELRQPRTHYQAATVVLVETSLRSRIHPAVHNLALPVRGQALRVTGRGGVNTTRGEHQARGVHVLRGVVRARGRISRVHSHHTSQGRLVPIRIKAVLDVLAGRCCQHRSRRAHAVTSQVQLRRVHRHVALTQLHASQDQIGRAHV